MSERLLPPESMPALGPGERPIEETIVDSATFPEFALRLTQEPNYFQFDSTLHLPYLSAPLREIATFDNEVPVFSDEDHVRLREVHDSIDQFSLWKFAKETGVALRNANLAQTAQGERFSLLTYDWENASWGHEGILPGAMNQVEIDRADYYGKLLGTLRQPTFEVHTHPTDSLFSPDDYHQLIAALPNGERRSRGMIVMCPEIQIMALATKQTPIIDFEEIPDQIEAWHDELRMTNVVERAISKRDAIDNQYLAYHEALEKEVHKDLKKLDKKASKHTLNEKAYRRKAGEIYLAKRPSLTKDLEHMKRKAAKAQRRVLDEYQHLLNQGLVKLARDLNIQLYTSTDMETFTAFSA